MWSFSIFGSIDKTMSQRGIEAVSLPSISLAPTLNSSCDGKPMDTRLFE
jgi:hypothetical protein